MNPRLKAIIFYLVDVRSIILAFAVFNFILVWEWDSVITFTCAACPWYHPWRYANEPTLLLGAAIFLRLNRWWAYIVALVLSSLVIGKVIFLFSLIENAMASLRADWKGIGGSYPYFVGSWESQYLFAVIILFCSAFYLSRYILRLNSEHHRGG